MDSLRAFSFPSLSALGSHDADLNFWYRMHCSLLRAILVHAATIGYAREPSFPPRAEGERSPAERIAYALKNVPVLKEAVGKEKDSKLVKTKDSGRKSKL